MLICFLWAILLGVVEGVTEWLPVSSTGHLLLFQSAFDVELCRGMPPSLYAGFCEMFDVVIQLGAIAAVAVRFFPRLWPFERCGSACRDGLRDEYRSGQRTECREGTRDGPRYGRHNGALRWRPEAVRLWRLLLLASLPAAFAGLVLDRLLERLTGRDIDGWLYTPAVIAAALIVYGVLFIAVELRGRHGRRGRCRDGGGRGFNSVHSVANSVKSAKSVNSVKSAKSVNIAADTAGVGAGVALGMGVCQMLAIVPGTSRSGATMLGAMLMGLTRPAAAEFSFLMAVPAMAGAGLIKACGFVRLVAQSGETVPAAAWAVLAVASLTAFLVSAVTINFLTDFVKRHTLIPFGIYRLALGVAVLIYFWMV